MLRLRCSLAEAVKREDYEDAAVLRDRIRQLSDGLREERK